MVKGYFSGSSVTDFANVKLVTIFKSIIGLVGFVGVMSQKRHR